VSDQAVLIAAAAELPALQTRLASEAVGLAAFADTEALRALEVITTRRPRLVLLERKFAATPRGAALINRIKADKSLVETEIRIVPPDGAAGHTDTAALESPTAPEMPHIAPAAAAVTPPHAPTSRRELTATELDNGGTRRSPRVRMAGSLEMVVDGTRGNVVDLSTGGAQVLTATVLKPNQRVRVALSDTEGTIRCAATVVWASFEIPKGAKPRYRVGIEFIDPDVGAITGYQQRHGQ
jgi:hypothetical protein